MDMKRKVCLMLVLFQFAISFLRRQWWGGKFQPGYRATCAGKHLIYRWECPGRLSWENANGATTYNIYWSTTAGVVKKTGTKISAVSSPYYHSGLNNGTDLPLCRHCSKSIW